MIWDGPIRVEDVVICIDGSERMKPMIDTLKENARALYEKVEEVFNNEWASLDKLRVKVIVFRDFAGEAEPIQQSDFFSLPEQNDEFASFVNSIEAKGGGDGAENALEAIALAMNSDWTTEGYKRRQVVVVLTDAAFLPLGARAECPGYPADLPKDLPELKELWDGTKVSIGNFVSKYGRLMLFVPQDDGWRRFEDLRYTCVKYIAGGGCEDFDFGEIVDMLFSVWLC